MVWNTIAHPRMMTNPGDGGVEGTPMPLQYVSTGKQNVYDLILSVNQEGVTIAYGDYDDLCAKLVRGELVLGTLVTLTKIGNIGIRQDVTLFSPHKSIAMTTQKTIHGKPVLAVGFNNDNGFVIDCNNTIYVAAEAPFDSTDSGAPHESDDDSGYDK